jgi:aldose 1-epimerase
MTSGEIATVEGTPFDFRTPKKVGQDINADNEQLHNGLGYDHNMVLNTNGDISKVAASVTDATSGIKMEVLTDEPGIQFYVGNFLDGNVKGKRGIAYPKRSAICLETQHYPDSPNKDNFPSVVVRPGDKYTSHCIYRFSTEAK